MRYQLNINGQTITAPAGETLVDAALMAKVLIPHDCASGQCETCRVRLAWGNVDDGGSSYGDTVLACQARVTGDATITYETTPAVSTVRGKVESITALSHDVIELIVTIQEALPYRPGQYAKLTLDGYPTREYSFSAKMRGKASPEVVVFQIKRFSKGRVSSALGHAITKGHNLKLSGPFGSAFLRHQETGPLVLTSSGTGFAPIWSLARAATLANDNRPMTIITGVKSPSDIYMLDAFRWLQEHGQKKIFVAAREGANQSILPGTADQYLPKLNQNTSIHVAGNQSFVERVKQQALTAQANCHADPFIASSNELSWYQRVASLPKIFRN